MPELPEVETIKTALQQSITGKTISHVTVLWPKLVKQPDDVLAFRTRLAGQMIHAVFRRGKFLKLLLDDDVLVSHLRMEGRYVLCGETEPYDKHTHVMFAFTDGTELRYRDVRKFGTMHLFAKGEEEKHLPLSQLGPEPLGQDFTQVYMAEAFAKTTRNIKTVLLDQTFVAGLGNIYVDESLFRAGIAASQLACRLGMAQIRSLRRMIQTVLEEAIGAGGSTVRTYRSGDGEMGRFQLSLYVYGREGEPCRVCGTPIKKEVVAGRGTHFCPVCQRGE